MRALSESRFLIRLGSHLVEKIVVARARLLALPADNPVAGALAAAAMVTGETWLDHARMVMVGLGVRQDFPEFTRLDDATRADPVPRRAAVRRWKFVMVVPAIRRMEAVWFCDQLAALNECLIPYAELVPFRAPPSDELRWAAWGKTMWRFCRAWAAARVSGGFPWSVWGQRVSSITRILKVCPLCGSADADLEHLLG